MMKISNEDKKLKNACLFLKRLPWLTGERLFLSIIVSFLICLLAGGFIFHRYNLQIKDTKPETPETVIKFEKDAFQNLTEEWTEREADFEAVKQKEYPNLFQQD